MNNKTDEGRQWGTEDPYSQVQRGLNVEAMVEGETESETFQRRMENLGNHVVSTGENPGSPAKRLIRGIVAAVKNRRSDGD